MLLEDGYELSIEQALPVCNLDSPFRLVVGGLVLRNRPYSYLTKRSMKRSMERPMEDLFQSSEQSRLEQMPDTSQPSPSGLRDVAGTTEKGAAIY